MVKKKLVLSPILARLAQIRVADIFFSKILHCQSLDITVSFYHDKILKKCSEGRIDRQTRVIS